MHDSTIIRDEAVQSYDEGIKTISVNFNEKEVYCKT